MSDFDKNNVEVSTSTGIKDADAVEVKGFFNHIKYFFKNLYLDIVASFKYNNMKLSGMLICVPGVMLGFFINFHYQIIKTLSYKVETEEYFDAALGQWVGGDIVSLIPDFSAVCFFALMLFGTLNVFTGFGCMGKKNKGSVISAAVTTGAIVLFSLVYLFYIFFYLYLQETGQVGSLNPLGLGNINFIMVLLSVFISVGCSIVGVILGYINYDRSYNAKDAR